MTMCGLMMPITFNQGRQRAHLDNQAGQRFEQDQKFHDARMSGLQIQQRRDQMLLDEASAEASIPKMKRDAFNGTEYGKPENEKFLKQTIVARILTGDKSAGNYTKEQAAWADKLKKMTTQQ